MRSSHFPGTRWSLVYALKDGSTDAMVRILQLYAPSIEIYLRRRLVNEVPFHLLDDIIQDVLLDLYERKEVLAQAQPGDSSRFRYLLMRVAYNAARNARRKLQRGDRCSAPTAVLESSSEALDVTAVGEDLSVSERRAMDRAWGLSIVQQAVRDCLAWSDEKPTDQEAIAAVRLEWEEAVSQREIAKRLKLSLATAHRRLATGRMLVRRAMIDHLIALGECIDADHAHDALQRVWEAVTEDSMGQG